MRNRYKIWCALLVSIINILLISTSSAQSEPQTSVKKQGLFNNFNLKKQVSSNFKKFSDIFTAKKQADLSSIKKQVSNIRKQASGAKKQADTGVKKQASFAKKQGLGNIKKQAGKAKKNGGGRFKKGGKKKFSGRKKLTGNTGQTLQALLDATTGKEEVLGDSWDPSWPDESDQIEQVDGLSLDDLLQNDETYLEENFNVEDENPDQLSQLEMARIDNDVEKMIDAEFQNIIREEGIDISLEDLMNPNNAPESDMGITELDRLSYFVLTLGHVAHNFRKSRGALFDFGQFL